MTKDLKLKCNCPGGERVCGTLYIIKIDKDSLEFNFIPPGRKKVVCGIYLEKKDLKKLKKFINE